MSRKAFENLRYAHVCTLLDIIDLVKLDNLPYIRKKFGESAEGFDEVVSFMTKLGVVMSDGQKLNMKVNSLTSNSDYRRSEIIRMLLSKTSRYRKEMFSFINQFKIIEGEMTYSPSDQSRSSESGVRNFLIEVGIVTHDMKTQKYVLMPEYASLFASARNSANYTSPRLLENIVEDRNNIGFKAEELIVKYERARIGTSYADLVDHVSLRNCAAGYDVKSVSIDKDGQVVPRFIEVKAVSPTTFQFYWSKNEVAVARALSCWYYLYLLPCKRIGQFEIDRLMIVSDPHNTVLAENSDWITEPDALICYTKRQHRQITMSKC